MTGVAILGAGSFGTALGIHLSKKGICTTLCVMEEKKYEILEKNRENILSLKDIPFPENLKISKDVEATIKSSNVVIIAVASKYTRSTLEKIKPYINENHIFVEVAKGFEEDSLMTLYEVVKSVFPKNEVAVLSGPSHAEELGRLIPTSCVIATDKKSVAEYLQNIFMSENFRIYTNPDVLGVCLGGALKNVIALAAGIADGLSYGDNSKAGLITRGIAEISRLGVLMGANIATFAGLSGIGDLIVTCASRHSRNRRAGYLIGSGKTKDEAIKEVGAVVEGVYAAKSAYLLSKKYNCEMPIVFEVNEVLFSNKSPKDAVYDLMNRDKVVEIMEVSWNEEDK